MMLEKADLKDLDKIIELRQEVLHPGGPRDRVVYPQDKNESSLHLICKNEIGEVLAAGTLFFENENTNEVGGGAFELRIRGMAVKEELRGKGIGSKILDEFIAFAKEKRVTKVWCNGRTRVLPLYERRGFVKTGEPFDVPGSGPHYRMRLFLTR